MICKQCAASYEWQPIVILGVTMPAPEYCEACGKRKMEEREAEVRREKLEARCKQLPVDVWSGSPPNKECANEIVRACLNGGYNPKSLYIYGEPRSGRKTSASFALRIMAERHDAHFKWFVLPELCERLTVKHDDFDYLPFLRNSNQIIVVDGWGSGKLMPSAKTKVLQMLSSRTSAGKPTWLISVPSSDELSSGEGPFGRWFDDETMRLTFRTLARECFVHIQAKRNKEER